MKFSIVTPTCNSERFLDETIRSVISQKGDFRIEYIVIDNYSKDHTVDIVTKYQRLIENRSWAVECSGIEIIYYQENDTGMYDAINRGFSRATGDIWAWINSDDVYLPGAFEAVGRAFSQFPGVRWLKGITSYIDESSKLYEEGQCFMYDQEWLKMGVYGREAIFVQQDSVFWREDLWRKAGGIDSRLKRAGDYYLWINFAKFEPLYTLKRYVSCFRKVEGQLSEDREQYRRECDLVVPVRKNTLLAARIWLFFAYGRRFCPIILRKYLYRLLFGIQDLRLIESTATGAMVMKSVPYYVAGE